MANQIDITPLLKAIGDRVRTRRKALGYTQEKLGELADLSTTYIAKLEAGVKTPSLETVIALSQALQIDAGELVGKREASDDFERAKNLQTAFDGLSEDDAEFAQQELLHLIAHLRKRSI